MSNLPWVYRNFTLKRTSKSAAGSFLQHLVASGGSITSMFTLTNGFPASQAQYYSSFYRLRFFTQADLEVFESYGYATTDIEKVDLN